MSGTFDRGGRFGGPVRDFQDDERDRLRLLARSQSLPPTRDAPLFSPRGGAGPGDCGGSLRRLVTSPRGGGSALARVRADGQALPWRVCACCAGRFLLLFKTHEAELPPGRASTRLPSRLAKRGALPCLQVVFDKDFPTLGPRDGSSPSTASTKASWHVPSSPSGEAPFPGIPSCKGGGPCCKQGVVDRGAVLKEDLGKHTGIAARLFDTQACRPLQLALAAERWLQLL
jgi:hypothetical protein